LHVGSPTRNLALDSLDSGVAMTCCCPDVEAWEPSQNSVDPVFWLNGQRGMLAITKNGHWNGYELSEQIKRGVYLGMEESDVFVYWLTKPVRPWQGIVPCNEVEYGICSKIPESGRESKYGTERLHWVADSRIHDLDYKRVEEDIVIKVLGIFQRRSLEDVG
jgi:hypothetical protein